MVRLSGNMTGKIMHFEMHLQLPAGIYFRTCRCGRTRKWANRKNRQGQWRELLLDIKASGFRLDDTLLGQFVKRIADLPGFELGLLPQLGDGHAFSASFDNVIDAIQNTGRFTGFGSPCFFCRRFSGCRFLRCGRGLPGRGAKKPPRRAGPARRLRPMPRGRPRQLRAGAAAPLHQGHRLHLFGVPHRKRHRHPAPGRRAPLNDGARRPSS